MGNSQKKKQQLLDILNASFDDLLPTTGVIGQIPENNHHLALNAIIKNPRSNGEVSRGTLNGFTYSVVKNKDYKEVFVSALTKELDTGASLTAAEMKSHSDFAFKHMEEILAKEDLGFADVVRQWNYMEDIGGVHTTPDGIKQNYQIFNDVRSRFYEKASFKNGYPSATGIGMNVGGVVIEFIAMSPAENLRIAPISNPDQIDAHNYSQKVLIGQKAEEFSQKTTPKFERAKLVQGNDSCMIFISGTAAIKGEAGISQDNVVKQTEITIDNIQRLIAAENLQQKGICSQARVAQLSFLRIYVKHKKDIESVREVTNKYFQGVPSLFLVADICRNDLLVELEGVVPVDCIK